MFRAIVALRVLLWLLWPPCPFAVVIPMSIPIAWPESVFDLEWLAVVCIEPVLTFLWLLLDVL